MGASPATPAPAPHLSAMHAIVGPTGAGKSSVAMQWARAADTPVEVVAVDAFTVYRSMDVGTAKPSPADRAEVPHHMIDVLDPDQDVTVAWFQARARAAIDDIRARGHIALLVGGSGLYFRAVVDDLQFPPTDPAVRDDIERRWVDDPAAAHRHLAEVDPPAAERIGPGNLRRTVRALEVLELSGQPFSSFATAWEEHRSIYDELAVTYLEPPAEQLRAAITRRAHHMVEAGLVEEARALRAAHPQGLSSTASQGIGYGEAFAVLDGHDPIEGLADRIARRTWKYARRQRSWFRRDPRCRPESRGPGHVGPGPASESGSDHQ